MANIDRRDFLKSAPLGAATYVAAANGLIAGADAQTRPPGAAGNAKLSGTSYTPLLDYPIRPKRYSEVKITDTFWKPKIATNAAVTIPFQVQKSVEAGRGPNGNVLEAAIMSLATHPDAKLQAQVDARIRQLTESRDQGNRGFEVAATYFTVTGKRDLLDGAIRNADALYEDFTRNDPPFSGGERDAMNCIQLYRVTHDRKHLDLAKHYLDIRGREDSVNRSRHNQSYKPVLEQREAVGHAVNGVTLMVSLADVGVLTGLKPYFNAAQAMWLDAVEKKMYVTGGVGATGNEGFGEPYWLPNISAYSETCAVLMFMTLNHRMFMATGDSKYIDVLERGLYNNAIDGVSVSGDRFFYVNRLASAGDGRDHRWDRASLECCPPNLVRFFASMPGLVYAQGPKDAIYVNLYVSSQTSFEVEGKPLGLSVESEMPWGGRSTITVSTDRDVKATLRLRIPGWARNQAVPGPLYAYMDRTDQAARVLVNGKPVAAVPDKTGYVSLDRQWQKGDTITVELPVEVRRVVAQPVVTQNRGKMAIERGPLVYCAEWPDAADGRVLDLLVDRSEAMKPAIEKELFGGVTVIHTAARRITNPAAPAKPVKLVPYYLWANRGPGEMSVWLSTREFAIGDTGPAGGLIFHQNPNYAADGWRYLEAAPFDQSAGATWGCFRRAIPGARGTAVGTGRQNTIDILAECKDPGTAAALCASLNLNGVAWLVSAVTR